ncbi:hypothetical protein GH714_018375 [Hevea brasiliensis]|uniref:Bet v I/Major latex protein domain-containing protein n=1 Tax=Hevea brasiliensis TaxID=3981 RepID=A0A6A6MJD2_HEVBR|nr:hypothetical protein GH714_018375 [Hevea brasiliensis]
MGVLTFQKETATAIPPAKMFKVFVLEADTAIPSIVPQAVKSVEIIEGNGGPGTIKKTTFAEVYKTKVEAVDKDNFKNSYSIIEAEPKLDVIEKISYEIEIVASPDGGSIIKSTSKYFPKGNSQINEEQVKTGAEKALGLFKAVEAYLLANPDAYN